MSGSGDVQFGLRLKVDASESQKFTGVTDDISKVTQAAKQSSVAMSETSDEVKKLLDKYDPLGSKLKTLQGDFNALSAAAKNGLVGNNQDTQYDQVMARLATQMRELKAAAEGAGPAAGEALAQVAAGAEKSMFATVGARRELMVLGHEALTGNLSRMPGSFMVLAERINLSGMALLGFGAAALLIGGSVIGLAKAYSDGAAEMESMNNALAITSNFAGQTRGSMRQLADEMANTGQVTIGQGKDIVTALVGSGRIGTQAIADVSRLAGAFAKATGEDIDKIAPELVKLFSDPARGADELNRSMHFLTAAEREQIDILQQQGREGEAQLLLAQKTSDHLQKHKESLSGLGELLKGVKQNWSDFWDAAEGLGRTDTIETRLEAAHQKLLKSRAHVAFGPNEDQANAEYQALLQQKAEADAKAAADATAAQGRDRQNKGYDLIKRYSPSRKIQDLQAEKSTVSDFMPTGSDSDIARQKQQKADSIAKIDEEIASIRNRGRAEEMAATKAALDEKAKLIDDAAKKAQDEEKRRVTLGLESAQDAARKSFEIEASRIQQREQILAQQYQNAQKGGDKKGMAQSLGEMQKLAQDYGAAYTKMGDDVAIADKKMEDATKKADLVVTDLQANFAKQNDAAQRGMEIQPAAQKALEDALAKVDDAGRKYAEQLEKMYLSKSISADTYATELAKVTDTTEAQRQTVIALNDAQQTLNDSWEYGTAKALQSYSDTLQSVSKTAESFVTKSLGSIENAFVKLSTTGKLTITDLFNTLAQEAARALYKQQFAPAVASMVGGISSYVGSMFSPGTSAPGGTAQNGGSVADFYSMDAIPNAKGNVYASADLHQYANTILTSPTLFKFAQGGAFGLAGEAGPEAIMPLSRGPDGKLGIKSQGGGSSGSVQVVVNDMRSTSNSSPVDVQTGSGSDGMQQIQLFIRDAVKSQIAAGALDKSMRDNFALSRVTTRRG